MGSETPRPLSARVQAYVFLIVALGLATFADSFYDLYHRPFEWGWTWLALVTVLCGWLAVRLPSGLATISISETFVICGALIYGPAVGTILVTIDALVLCLKEGYLARQLRWQKLLFNVASSAFSIWTGARIAGITGAQTPIDFAFVVRLAGFTTLYFLLNTALVSFGIALERGMSPWKIWTQNFVPLSLNFAASASVAAFVYGEGKLHLAFIGVSGPLLVVIYFTYHWSAKRVQAEQEKNEQLNRVFLSTVEALALAIDAKDQVTHGHIRRVQRHTMALAEALGVKDQRQLDAIRAAALLHDTGKLAVPEYILNKPGPLTASEFERMKVHAAVGADILKSIEFPYPVEPIVRHHHENWNGTGYPDGLEGQEIPLGARILSVVDCYDALTSDRPYRPRYARQQAEQILRERRNVMYDPWVVDGFLDILDKLERGDSEDRREMDGQSALAQSIPAQLDVISATQAEEREFNEMRRDLPRAANVSAAAEVVFRHVRRVIPAASLAFWTQKMDGADLSLATSTGSAAGVLQGVTIPVGDRISGWAFAHRQTVMNSDVGLEIGPVARTLPVPLRYAMAVPVSGPAVNGVIAAYGTEPFTGEHRRIVETAATLFSSSFPVSPSNDSADAPAEHQVSQTQRARVH